MKLLIYNYNRYEKIINILDTISDTSELKKQLKEVRKIRNNDLQIFKEELIKQWNNGTIKNILANYKNKSNTEMNEKLKSIFSDFINVYAEFLEKFNIAKDFLPEFMSIYTDQYIVKPTKLGGGLFQSNEPDLSAIALWGRVNNNLTTGSEMESLPKYEGSGSSKRMILTSGLQLLNDELKECVINLQQSRENHKKYMKEKYFKKKQIEAVKEEVQLTSGMSIPKINENKLQNLIRELILYKTHVYSDSDNKTELLQVKKLYEKPNLKQGWTDTLMSMTKFITKDKHSIEKDKKNIYPVRKLGISRELNELGIKQVYAQTAGCTDSTSDHICIDVTDFNKVSNLDIDYVEPYFVSESLTDPGVVMESQIYENDIGKKSDDNKYRYQHPYNKAFKLVSIDIINSSGWENKDPKLPGFENQTLQNEYKEDNELIKLCTSYNNTYNKIKGKLENFGDIDLTQEHIDKIFDKVTFKRIRDYNKDNSLEIATYEVRNNWYNTISYYNVSLNKFFQNETLITQELVRLRAGDNKGNIDKLNLGHGLDYINKLHPKRRINYAIDQNFIKQTLDDEKMRQLLTDEPLMTEEERLSIDYFNEVEKLEKYFKINKISNDPSNHNDYIKLSKILVGLKHKYLSLKKSINIPEEDTNVHFERSVLPKCFMDEHSEDQKKNEKFYLEDIDPKTGKCTKNDDINCGIEGKYVIPCFEGFNKKLGFDNSDNKFLIDINNFVEYNLMSDRLLSFSKKLLELKSKFSVVYSNFIENYVYQDNEILYSFKNEKVNGSYQYILFQKKIKKTGSEEDRVLIKDITNDRNMFDDITKNYVNLNELYDCLCDRNIDSSSIDTNSLIKEVSNDNSVTNLFPYTHREASDDYVQKINAMYDLFKDNILKDPLFIYLSDKYILDYEFLPDNHKLIYDRVNKILEKSNEKNNTGILSSVYNYGSKLITSLVKTQQIGNKKSYSLYTVDTKVMMASAVLMPVAAAQGTTEKLAKNFNFPELCDICRSVIGNSNPGIEIIGKDSTASTSNIKYNLCLECVNYRFKRHGGFYQPNPQIDPYLSIPVYNDLGLEPPNKSGGAKSTDSNNQKFLIKSPSSKNLENDAIHKWPTFGDISNIIGGNDKVYIDIHITQIKNFPDNIESEVSVLNWENPDDKLKNDYDIYGHKWLESKDEIKKPHGIFVCCHDLVNEYQFEEGRHIEKLRTHELSYNRAEHNLDIYNSRDDKLVLISELAENSQEIRDHKVSLLEYKNKNEELTSDNDKIEENKLINNNKNTSRTMFRFRYSDLNNQEYIPQSWSGITSDDESTAEVLRLDLTNVISRTNDDEKTSPHVILLVFYDSGWRVRQDNEYDTTVPLGYIKLEISSNDKLNSIIKNELEFKRFAEGNKDKREDNIIKKVKESDWYKQSADSKLSHPSWEKLPEKGSRGRQIYDTLGGMVFAKNDLEYRWNFHNYFDGGEKPYTHYRGEEYWNKFFNKPKSNTKVNITYQISYVKNISNDEVQVITKIIKERNKKFKLEVIDDNTSSNLKQRTADLESLYEGLVYPFTDLRSPVLIDDTSELQILYIKKGISKILFDVEKMFNHTSEFDKYDDQLIIEIKLLLDPYNNNVISSEGMYILNDIIKKISSLSKQLDKYKLGKDLKNHYIVKKILRNDYISSINYNISKYLKDIQLSIFSESLYVKENFSPSVESTDEYLITLTNTIKTLFNIGGKKMNELDKNDIISLFSIIEDDFEKNPFISNKKMEDKQKEEYKQYFNILSDNINESLYNLLFYKVWIQVGTYLIDKLGSITNEINNDTNNDIDLENRFKHTDEGELSLYERLYIVLSNLKINSENSSNKFEISYLDNNLFSLPDSKKLNTENKELTTENKVNDFIMSFNPSNPITDNDFKGAADVKKSVFGENPINNTINDTLNELDENELKQFLNVKHDPPSTIDTSDLLEYNNVLKKGKLYTVIYPTENEENMKKFEESDKSIIMDDTLSDMPKMKLALFIVLQRYLKGTNQTNMKFNDVNIFKDVLENIFEKMFGKTYIRDKHPRDNVMESNKYVSIDNNKIILLSAEDDTSSNHNKKIESINESLKDSSLYFWLRFIYKNVSKQSETPKESESSEENELAKLKLLIFNYNSNFSNFELSLDKFSLQDLIILFNLLHKYLQNYMNNRKQVINNMESYRTKHIGKENSFHSKEILQKDNIKKHIEDSFFSNETNQKFSIYNFNDFNDVIRGPEKNRVDAYTLGNKKFWTNIYDSKNSVYIVNIVNKISNKLLDDTKESNFFSFFKRDNVLEDSSEMEKRLRYIDYMYKFNIHTHMSISTGESPPSCFGSVNTIDGSNSLYAPCLYPSENYRNNQIHNYYPKGTIGGYMDPNYLNNDNMSNLVSTQFIGVFKISKFSSDLFITIFYPNNDILLNDGQYLKVLKKYENTVIENKDTSEFSQSGIHLELVKECTRILEKKNNNRGTHILPIIFTSPTAIEAAIIYDLLVSRYHVDDTNHNYVLNFPEYLSAYVKKNNSTTHLISPNQIKKGVYSKIEKYNFRKSNNYPEDDQKILNEFHNSPRLMIDYFSDNIQTVFAMKKIPIKEQPDSESNVEKGSEKSIIKSRLVPIFNTDEDSNEKKLWNSINGIDSKLEIKEDYKQFSWFELDVKGINLRIKLQNFWNKYSDILSQFTDINTYLKQYNDSKKEISIFDVIICFYPIVEEICTFNKEVSYSKYKVLSKIIKINEEVFDEINKCMDELKQNQSKISYAEILDKSEKYLVQYDETVDTFMRWKDTESDKSFILTDDRKQISYMDQSDKIDVTNVTFKFDPDAKTKYNIQLIVDKLINTQGGILIQNIKQPTEFSENWLMKDIHIPPRHNYNDYLVVNDEDNKKLLTSKMFSIIENAYVSPPEYPWEDGESPMEIWNDLENLKVEFKPGKLVVSFKKPNRTDLGNRLRSNVTITKENIKLPTLEMNFKIWRSRKLYLIKDKRLTIDQDLKFGNSNDIDVAYKLKSDLGEKNRDGSVLTENSKPDLDWLKTLNEQIFIVDLQSMIKLNLCQVISQDIDTDNIPVNTEFTYKSETWKVLYSFDVNFDDQGHKSILINGDKAIIRESGDNFEVDYIVTTEIFNQIKFVLGDSSIDGKEEKQFKNFIKGDPKEKEFSFMSARHGVSAIMGEDLGNLKQQELDNKIRYKYNMIKRYSLLPHYQYSDLPYYMFFEDMTLKLSGAPGLTQNKTGWNTENYMDYVPIFYNETSILGIGTSMDKIANNLNSPEILLECCNESFHEYLDMGHCGVFTRWGPLGKSEEKEKKNGVKYSVIIPQSSIGISDGSVRTDGKIRRQNFKNYNCLIDYLNPKDRIFMLTEQILNLVDGSGLSAKSNSGSINSGYVMSYPQDSTEAISDNDKTGKFLYTTQYQAAYNRSIRNHTVSQYVNGRYYYDTTYGGWSENAYKTKITTDHPFRSLSKNKRSYPKNHKIFMSAEAHQKIDNDNIKDLSDNTNVILPYLRESVTKEKKSEAHSVDVHGHIYGYKSNLNYDMYKDGNTDETNEFNFYKSNIQTQSKKYSNSPRIDAWQNAYQNNGGVIDTTWCYPYNNLYGKNYQLVDNNSNKLNLKSVIDSIPCEVLPVHDKVNGVGVKSIGANEDSIVNQYIKTRNFDLPHRGRIIDEPNNNNSSEYTFNIDELNRVDYKKNLDSILELEIDSKKDDVIILRIYELNHFWKYLNYQFMQILGFVKLYKDSYGNWVINNNFSDFDELNKSENGCNDKSPDELGSGSQYSNIISQGEDSIIHDSNFVKKNSWLPIHLNLLAIDQRKSYNTSYKQSWLEGTGWLKNYNVPLALNLQPIELNEDKLHILELNQVNSTQRGAGNGSKIQYDVNQKIKIYTSNNIAPEFKINNPFDQNFRVGLYNIHFEKLNDLALGEPYHRYHLYIMNIVNNCAIMDINNSKNYLWEDVYYYEGEDQKDKLLKLKGAKTQINQNDSLSNKIIQGRQVLDVIDKDDANNHKLFNLLFRISGTNQSSLPFRLTPRNLKIKNMYLQKLATMSLGQLAKRVYGGLLRSLKQLGPNALLLMYPPLLFVGVVVSVVYSLQHFNLTYTKEFHNKDIWPLKYEYMISKRNCFNGIFANSCSPFYTIPRGYNPNGSNTISSQFTRKGSNKALTEKDHIFTIPYMSKFVSDYNENKRYSILLESSELSHLIEKNAEYNTIFKSLQYLLVNVDYSLEVKVLKDMLISNPEHTVYVYEFKNSLSKLDNNKNGSIFVNLLSRYKNKKLIGLTESIYDSWPKKLNTQIEQKLKDIFKLECSEPKNEAKDYDSITFSDIYKKYLNDTNNDNKLFITDGDLSYDLDIPYVMEFYPEWVSQYFFMRKIIDYDFYYKFKRIYQKEKNILIKINYNKSSESISLNVNIFNIIELEKLTHQTSEYATFDKLEPSDSHDSYKSKNLGSFNVFEQAVNPLKIYADEFSKKEDLNISDHSLSFKNLNDLQSFTLEIENGAKISFIQIVKDSLKLIKELLRNNKVPYISEIDKEVLTNTDKLNQDTGLTTESSIFYINHYMPKYILYIGMIDYGDIMNKIYNMCKQLVEIHIILENKTYEKISKESRMKNLFDSVTSLNLTKINFIETVTLYPRNDNDLNTSIDVKQTILPEYDLKNGEKSNLSDKHKKIQLRIDIKIELMSIPSIIDNNKKDDIAIDVPYHKLYDSDIELFYYDKFGFNSSSNKFSNELDKLRSKYQGKAKQTVSEFIEGQVYQPEMLSLDSGLKFIDPDSEYLFFYTYANDIIYHLSKQGIYKENGEIRGNLSKNFKDNYDISGEYELDNIFNYDSFNAYIIPDKFKSFIDNLNSEKGFGIKQSLGYVSDLKDNQFERNSVLIFKVFSSNNLNKIANEDSDNKYVSDGKVWEQVLNEIKRTVTNKVYHKNERNDKYEWQSKNASWFSSLFRSSDSDKKINEIKNKIFNLILEDGLAEYMNTIYINSESSVSKKANKSSTLNQDSKELSEIGKKDGLQYDKSIYDSCVTDDRNDCIEKVKKVLEQIFQYDLINRRPLEDNPKQFNEPLITLDTINNYSKIREAHVLSSDKKTTTLYGDIFLKDEGIGSHFEMEVNITKEGNWNYEYISKKILFFYIPQIPKYRLIKTNSDVKIDTQGMENKNELGELTKFNLFGEIRKSANLNDKGGIFENFMESFLTHNELSTIRGVKLTTKLNTKSGNPSWIPDKLLINNPDVKYINILQRPHGSTFLGMQNAIEELKKPTSELVTAKMSEYVQDGIIATAEITELAGLAAASAAGAIPYLGAPAQGSAEAAVKSATLLAKQSAPYVQKIITSIVTYNQVLDILDILQSIFNPFKPCVSLLTIFLASKLDKDTRLTLVQEPAEQLIEKFRPVFTQFSDESKLKVKPKKVRKVSKDDNYSKLANLLKNYYLYDSNYKSLVLNVDNYKFCHECLDSKSHSNLNEIQSRILLNIDIYLLTSMYNMLDYIKLLTITTIKKRLLNLKDNISDRELKILISKLEDTLSTPLGYLNELSNMDNILSKLMRKSDDIKEIFKENKIPIKYQDANVVFDNNLVKQILLQRFPYENKKSSLLKYTEYDSSICNVKSNIYKLYLYQLSKYQFTKKRIIPKTEKIIKVTGILEKNWVEIQDDLFEADIDEDGIKTVIKMYSQIRNNVYKFLSTMNKKEQRSIDFIKLYKIINFNYLPDEFNHELREYLNHSKELLVDYIKCLQEENPIFQYNQSSKIVDNLPVGLSELNKLEERKAAGKRISKIFETQENVDDYLKQFEGLTQFQNDKNIVFSSKPKAGGETQGSMYMVLNKNVSSEQFLVATARIKEQDSKLTTQFVFSIQFFFKFEHEIDLEDWQGGDPANDLVYKTICKNALDDYNSKVNVKDKFKQEGADEDSLITYSHNFGERTAKLWYDESVDESGNTTWKANDTFLVKVLLPYLNKKAIDNSGVAVIDDLSWPPTEGEEQGNKVKCIVLYKIHENNQTVLTTALGDGIIYHADMYLYNKMFFQFDTVLYASIENQAEDHDGVSFLHHSNNPIVITDADSFKQTYEDADNRWQLGEKELADKWFSNNLGGSYVNNNSYSDSNNLYKYIYDPDKKTRHNINSIRGKKILKNMICSSNFNSNNQYLENPFFTSDSVTNSKYSLGGANLGNNRNTKSSDVTQTTNAESKKKKEFLKEFVDSINSILSIDYDKVSIPTTNKKIKSFSIQDSNFVITFVSGEIQQTYSFKLKNKDNLYNIDVPDMYLEKTSYLKDSDLKRKESTGTYPGIDGSLVSFHHTKNIIQYLNYTIPILKEATKKLTLTTIHDKLKSVQLVEILSKIYNSSIPLSKLDDFKKEIDRILCYVPIDIYKKINNSDVDYSMSTFIHKFYYLSKFDKIPTIKVKAATLDELLKFVNINVDEETPEYIDLEIDKCDYFIIKSVFTSQTIFAYPNDNTFVNINIASYFTLLSFIYNQLIQHLTNNIYNIITFKDDNIEKKLSETEIKHPKHSGFLTNFISYIFNYLDKVDKSKLEFNNNRFVPYDLLVNTYSLSNFGKINNYLRMYNENLFPQKKIEITTIPTDREEFRNWYAKNSEGYDLNNSLWYSKSFNLPLNQYDRLNIDKGLETLLKLLSTDDAVRIFIYANSLVSNKKFNGKDSIDTYFISGKGYDNETKSLLSIDSIKSGIENFYNREEKEDIDIKKVLRHSASIKNKNATLKRLSFNSEILKLDETSDKITPNNNIVFSATDINGNVNSNMGIWILVVDPESEKEIHDSTKEGEKNLKKFFVKIDNESSKKIFPNYPIFTLENVNTLISNYKSKINPLKRGKKDDSISSAVFSIGINSRQISNSNLDILYNGTQIYTPANNNSEYQLLMPETLIKDKEENTYQILSNFKR